jgi:capsular exopolysaccharide synthesis family protein
MIAPSPHPAKTPPRPPFRDGEHYRHLFRRNKWFLLLSGPTVFIAALAYVFFIMRPENPKLSARTLIGLERPTDVSGLKVGATANLGREDIMLSRTFLRDVAKQMSLQLQTQPAARGELFDFVQLDSTAQCGTYRVHFNPKKLGEYYILRYDTTALSLPLFGILPGTRFKELVAGNWTKDAFARMSGMKLQFSQGLRTKPVDFGFRVVDIRVAVEEVIRNLTVKRADPDKGINYITVLLESRDYALSAATGNAIADAFIEKNFHYRKQRANGIVESLEKQLGLSKVNLAGADAKIRDFHSLHPQIGLNQQTQQTILSLARLDNGIQGQTSSIENAETLESQFAGSDSSERFRQARVIAEFLSANSVPAGRSLLVELDRLTAQREKWNDTYGSEHPLVLESQANLHVVADDIQRALSGYIAAGRGEVTQKNRNSRQLSSQLSQLPALEMELGELIRRQQIFSDIYSAVLGSYNKAKIDDAVSISDFYVMDYAVAALPPPPNQGQLVFLFALLALLLSFGPVLAYDAFDKTVRSQRQLERITSRQVLELIPVFYPVSGTKKSGGQPKRPLIHVPCFPIFIREIFNSLQLKTNLQMLEYLHKFIVVSSLEDGAGKSTISANLAISHALRGHRTLLVDADLRRGMIGATFGLADSDGFAGLLANPNPLTLDDCARYLVKSSIPNLYILPSTPKAENPGSLLSSPRMQEFKQFCLKMMDCTIIDTPPLGAVSDAAALQNHFENYLFVVRYGQTKVADLVRRINEFDRLPEKVMGYVFNGVSADLVASYQNYSSYYAR